ncbi:MAG: prolyl oligopeptidase family serine peptidase [Thermoanaerobaculia bacterium]
MNRSVLASLILILLAVVSFAADTYQTPPPELAKLVAAPLIPQVSVSPDRATLLLLDLPPLPSIAEVSEEELRLAGVRINPRNFGPSRDRSANGLRLVVVKDGVETKVQGLPDAPRIRNTSWSDDGRYVAFTHDTASKIELWLLDTRSAKASRVEIGAINDVLVDPVQWDGAALVVSRVPTDLGKAPVGSSTPSGPVIQENIGKAAPNRTYQDLLRNAQDEALFDYYATVELVRVALDGTATPLGVRGVISSFEPSPDGRFILTETLHRPYSYLVPQFRFPHRIDVLDRDGKLVKTIADIPLKEDVPLGFGSVPTGMRGIGWRNDTPATLAWVEALDEGNARKPAEQRDRLFMLPAPFDGGPVALVTFPLRYGGIIWGDDSLALVTESWWTTRKVRTWAIDPSKPGSAPKVLFDYSSEDGYAHPGSPMTELDARGRRRLAMDASRNFFLLGAGASPEGDRPFVRRYEMKSGKTAELFRSAAPRYEMPVAFLDAARRTLLTRAETPDTPPNYFARDLRKGTPRALTSFPHPYPELKGVSKELITYKRKDGVTLSATLYLPAGYDAKKDGPLPAFVWAYPNEYKSAAAAAQIQDSPYRFKTISYWGAVPWVTRGYAILDDAAMPVIGEGDKEPNDSFVDQLVMNAQAVIDEGVRRGVVDPKRVAVGGHSYGAFMTGNLLAHTDLFRAGIARSGAYNRSLTPFGFQSEERTYWEAPQVYATMSPFSNADRINEPILLIHGEADNNSGTFPIQSERLYNALKGLGKTTRFVLLPAESHGYRGYESIMHMLWEMDRWLETYVKNAKP